MLPKRPPRPGIARRRRCNILAGDWGIFGWTGYSRFVATGSDPGLAAGKRRGGAGADRIGQDLHLRAALSEPENSGGVHRPDPRGSCAFTRCIQKNRRRRSYIVSGL